MKYITFNTNYTLKPDDGRAIIMARFVGRNLIKAADDSFYNFIHPVYAMILSYIDGRDYDTCISDAATFLHVSFELVERFVLKLLDNSSEVFIKKKGEVIGSVFPAYTIISREKECIEKRYEPSIFEYTHLNLKMDRHMTPSSITVMFNNICLTDCVYCYEDKSIRKRCTIPFKRIMELIHEAYDAHVNSFDVIGGEFFLYEHWREVLVELRKYGFNPFLSTKMPISEKDVEFLSKIKIHDIQLSIDSMIEDHLRQSLKVPKGYVENLQKTLKCLYRSHIPVLVHTVLTKYNRSVEDMLSIYDIISKYDNIQEWHVVKGDPTLYPRVNYKDIEIDKEAMNNIVAYLKNVSANSKFNVILPHVDYLETNKDGKNSEVVMSKESFFSRSYCSGLFSSLYILPDGKVTICEQLYWHKPFLVGDITKQTLMEVWNSKEALSLFHLNQSQIPQDSLCHSCQDFKHCRENKQVCYREIVKKYGFDKWYYPDVNCPLVKQQKPVLNDE